MFDSLGNGLLFAGGAAVLTMLVTGWSYVKSAYQQVVSRFVVTVTVCGFEADAVLLYFKSRFRASRFGPRAYLGWMLYVRPRRRVQLVPMEITPPGGKLFWAGWRPLWTQTVRNASGEEMEAGVNARGYSEDGLSLTFFRGLFDPDRLIVEATEWYNRQIVENIETGGRRHSIRHIHGTAGKPASFGDGRERSRRGSGSQPSSNTDLHGCLPHRPLVWSFSELGPEQPEPGTSVDRLALAADALELVAEARRWKENEPWYKSRGIPWRRGWLLYGRPGTGKTALARSVAEDLDLPVFVYDLASLYNHELQHEWACMLAEVPCMALIEDIDAVFDKRRNVISRDQQHLTYDCLLNCLDGIERSDGLFLVITTNRLDRIDPALGLPAETADKRGRDSFAGTAQGVLRTNDSRPLLSAPYTSSTRPGRIDRVLELGPLEEAGRRKIASRILEDWAGEWEALVEAGDGDTGAQFQERCARRALELHYAEAVPKSAKRSRVHAADVQVV